jgi:hypothetical protein
VAPKVNSVGSPLRPAVRSKMDGADSWLKVGMGTLSGGFGNPNPRDGKVLGGTKGCCWKGVGPVAVVLGPKSCCSYSINCCWTAALF